MCADCCTTEIESTDVIVASTGVIGQPLNIDPIAAGIPALAAALETDCDPAAEAILTTDLVKKKAAVSFEIDGVSCCIGGIAKGSGMVHPNMATMLVFLTTDVAISPELLRRALQEDVQVTYNMVSVDGDTSTNDMVSILANGAAGNRMIDAKGADYDLFRQALNLVNTELCRKIAADGEGATKLIECVVSGADSVTDAQIVAKSVISSSLLKAAMFGSDANWGRVLCAIGYSGVNLDVNKVDVTFDSRAGSLPVCANGAGIPFSEEKAKDILTELEIRILVNLKMGSACATAWGCDLTYDYVKINGDYRS